MRARVGSVGLVEAVWVPGTQLLLLSRSHRQSTELFRLLPDYHLRMRSPMLKRLTVHEMVLENHSRIVCPGGATGGVACGGRRGSEIVRTFDF